MIGQTEYAQLTMLLLLSLTNLTLLPAIMLALYRRHYTECLVYWLTLVSGCLHHLCQHSSQLSPLCSHHRSALLYSDTMSQLLSVWVTVLSMAYSPDSLRSVLHITGGVAIAIATRIQHEMVMKTKKRVRTLKYFPSLLHVWLLVVWW